MKSHHRLVSGTAGAVAALILTGCGSEPATVIDKTYIPRGTTWVTKDKTVTRCTGTGKNRRCREVVVGQKRVRETRSECWRLTLREDDGDILTKCVSAGVYLKAKIGDRR
ncbi:hypothetical protein ACIBFB_12610 [Nocardiopsis sp. NPDC050513]|uniref:hypothetical protein n=1 Tax=Nocardiopsis sp. NPDC050513 TaxID=3364338 RepID=UPI0037A1BCDF